MYNIFHSDCRSKIKEKQTYIIQYETELQTVKFKHDSLSVNRMFTVKKKMDSLKKEVGYSLTSLVDRVNVNLNHITHVESKKVFYMKYSNRVKYNI